MRIHLERRASDSCTSAETSATLPGECGRKMAPPDVFMPMSFSMSARPEGSLRQQ